MRQASPRYGLDQIQAPAARAIARTIFLEVAMLLGAAPALCAADPPVLTVLFWDVNVDVNPYRASIPGCSLYEYGFDEPADYFAQTACSGSGPTPSDGAASILAVSSSTGVYVISDESVSTAAVPAGQGPDYWDCIQPQAQTRTNIRFALSNSSVMTMSLSSSMLLPSWFLGQSSGTLPADVRIYVSSAPGYPQGGFSHVPIGYSHPQGGLAIIQACNCNPHAPWSDTFQAFAEPGVYQYQTHSQVGYDTLNCVVDRRPTPAGAGSVYMSGAVSFETCLTITAQPPARPALCNGGVVVLGVEAMGASAAGTIRYQWQWRPSLPASWTNVQPGLNSVSGASFTASDPLSSGLVLDFSPGHGSFPESFQLRFRCVVSNDCTNETSGTAELRACGTCPPDPGGHVAKWQIGRFDMDRHMIGRVPVAPGSGWEQDFDCNKPTALILHGLISGPDADWVPCLAEAVRRRYNGEVNILIADASQHMAPVGVTAAAAITGWSVAVALGTPLAPQLLAAAAAAAYVGLKETQGNIPDAADDLATDFQCFLGPCGASEGIDLVIGHSFGGGIGADLGEKIVGSSGRLIPKLITIDSPYDVGPVNMDEQARRASRYFLRHLNYYSPCRSGFAAGSPIDGFAGANVRNFNAGAGSRVTSRCTEIQHVCLAAEICGLLSGDAGWGLIDGTLPPGEYMEGSSPNTVIPGNQSPNCEPLDVPAWDDPTVVGSDLGAGLNARQGVTDVNGVLELRPPGPSASSFASGTVTLFDCGGFLLFEYQIEGLLPDQMASVAWNGRVRWSASVDTPAGQWLTAIVDVRNGCVITGSLLFRLDPAASGQPNPASVFRVRNVRIIHRDIRRCIAEPAIVTQPASVTAPRGDAVALGVGTQWPYGLTYRWEGNGVAVVEGPQPAGAVAVGTAGPILVVSHLTALEAGEYRCIVTNACGSSSSNLAMLTVCIADYNRDGEPNSQDFFEFLAAFFLVQTSADVNADSLVNSQDFFDFLTAFFAGC